MSKSYQEEFEQLLAFFSSYNLYGASIFSMPRWIELSNSFKVWINFYFVLCPFKVLKYLWEFLSVRFDSGVTSSGRCHPFCSSFILIRLWWLSSFGFIAATLQRTWYQHSRVFSCFLYNQPTYSPLESYRSDFTLSFTFMALTFLLA